MDRHPIESRPALKPPAPGLDLLPTALVSPRSEWVSSPSLSLYPTGSSMLLDPHYARPSTRGKRFSRLADCFRTTGSASWLSNVSRVPRLPMSTSTAPARSRKEPLVHVKRPSDHLTESAANAVPGNQPLQTRLRIRPEDRAANRAALMTSETAALTMSRFYAMVPPPRLHRATDAGSKGTIASGGGKAPA